MPGPATLTRLTAGALHVRDQLEVLTRQASDGRKGAHYGDIAPDAPRAMDLRADIARRATLAEGIGRTLGRTEATQNVLSRLTVIARGFATTAAALTGGDAQEIRSAASDAGQALREVAGLLNERRGGEYLFGGSDTGNPPVPDAEGIGASGFAVRIAAAVATLGGGNAAAVAAETKAAAASDAPADSPFSAFLSDPARGRTETRRSTPADGGPTVEWGVPANRNGVARSTGETTGAWSRDLLRGLATLAALDPASAGAGQDFTALMEVVQGGLRSATDALGEESGALGQTEARLESARTRHAELGATLAVQLGDVEEVDLAETLTRLQATRTRLEASYQALATVGQLSLANFLR